MITAFLVGDTEVIARLNAMPGGLQSGLARAVTRLALQLERLVKEKLSGPVLNVRTGVLRSSIHNQVTKTSTSVMASVGTNVFYAKFHEYGVPHSWEIRPKSARVLAFEVSGASRGHILGATVFAARVTHPPLPERSFLRSALHEMEPLIREGIEKAVHQEAEKIHR